LWLLLLVRTIYELDFAVLRSYPAIGEGIVLRQAFLFCIFTMPLTSNYPRSLFKRKAATFIVDRADDSSSTTACTVAANFIGDRIVKGED